MYFACRTVTIGCPDPKNGHEEILLEWKKIGNTMMVNNIYLLFLCTINLVY